MPVPTDENARLRRFLLGQLSEPERVEVEQRLLNEEDLFQELLLLEEDLTDEYVFGDLPEAERARYEQQVAGSPDRLEAIRLARLLRGPGPAAAQGRKPRSGWWRAVAALLGLVALGGALMAYRQHGLRLEREAAAREEALRRENQALAHALQQERARTGGATASPATPPTVRPDAPTPRPAALPPILASLALTAGSVRSHSEVPTLKSPGPGGRVRLFLNLDEEAEQHYAADLLGDAGTVLWHSERLSSTGGVVVIVDLPSGLLAPGQYRVVLRQAETPAVPPEAVATYSFVVARE
jgi:hypothetical protein